jgi:UDP-glucuronate 4-epimerase
MSHILVTGGAGFIGSHLAERLVRDDNRVTVIDSFDSFYSPEIKRRNVRELLGDARFQLVEADIRDDRALDRACREKVDVIVHLAARAGVRPSLEQPKVYADVNVGGTLSLLELARRQEVRRFVFGSSSSVYGNDASPPFRESERADQPISPYAASKRAAELYAHAYHHLYGLTAASLRFFTVYGPRQRPDLAIHKFARRMLRGEPIHVFGDGSMRRDFTYVDDIVAGICSAIDWTETGSSHEVFNLGGSQTTSVKRLLELLEEVLNCEAEVVYQPEQAGDVDQTFADISKAADVLGYRPQTSLHDGLQRFAEWLKAEDKVLA